jgi:hypothetical protein
MRASLFALPIPDSQAYASSGCAVISVIYPLIRAEDKTMALGGLGDKMKEAAGGISAASLEKLYEYLDEFNHSMIVLGEFGFTVDKFTVGSGLVPGVTISIVGSLDSVDLEIVDKAIAEHEGRKIIVTLMQSIRTAKNIRARVTSLPFSDVRIDITLGLPPDISLDFIDA